VTAVVPAEEAGTAEGAAAPPALVAPFPLSFGAAALASVAEASFLATAAAAAAADEAAATADLRAAAAARRARGGRPFPRSLVLPVPPLAAARSELLPRLPPDDGTGRLPPLPLALPALPAAAAAAAAALLWKYE
jgi:hypothetical protein